MADLINTKIPLIKRTVTPNIEFQGNRNVFKKENSSKIQEFILPTSLIAGGGLLVYLGVRRPSAESVFKKIIKSHRIDIENEVPKFYEYTENAVSEFLEKSLQKIYNYKKQRVGEIFEKINDPIAQASDVTDIIRRQNNAFKIMDTELNPYLKSGTSEFDKYMVELSHDKKNLKDILSTESYQTRLRMEDKIAINTSKDFRKSIGEKKHDEFLNKSQKDLKDYIDFQCKKMEIYADKKISSSVNLQSEIMENIIVEIRDLLKETKENIITSAFVKMSKMLKNPNLKPSFKNPISLNKFSKLTPEELKPFEIPNKLEQMFCGNIYFNAVKTLDFNKLDNKTIQNIFYTGTPYNNINNIKIMIDRIRLLFIAEKSKGEVNSTIYENVIAKMEGLYVKLKDFGEKEFLIRCEQDFDSMSEEELKAKLYQMDKISRRLGYHALTQANRNFIRMYPQYSNLSFKNISELIRQHPEKYFM